MSGCNILMDFFSIVDYKTRYQQRLTVPPHPSDQPHGLPLPFLPSLRPKWWEEAKLCFLRQPLSSHSASVLSLSTSSLCLPSEEWFMTDIREETASFNSFCHFSYLYRVLIKQYLQIYLCDVMLGSSVVNMPFSVSTEFNINKSQINATLLSPCRIFSRHNWKPDYPPREIMNP